jgi:hypothetical protein
LRPLSYLCSMSTTIIKPKKLKQSKRIVDLDALVDLAQKTEELAQIVIHVFMNPQAEPYAIRIWKSTYLFASGADYRSKLLHAENISISPKWTEVNGHQAFAFTLFFEALPKEVRVFDLVEVIPQPGGFHHRNIHRNKTDVYTISL